MRLHGRVVLDRTWLAAMRQAPRLVENELRRMLRRSARVVRDRARSIAPRRKGRLQKSIRHKVSRLRGVVYSNLWYARVRNEGTGHLPGGVIRPRERRTRRVTLAATDPLRIRSGAHTKVVKLDKPQFWMQFQIDGRWVRTKQVRQKGTHFLESGLAQSRPDMQAEAEEAGRRIAKRVFGG